MCRQGPWLAQRVGTGRYDRPVHLEVGESLAITLFGEAEPQFIVERSASTSAHIRSLRTALLAWRDLPTTTPFPSTGRPMAGKPSPSLSIAVWSNSALPMERSGLPTSFFQPTLQRPPPSGSAPPHEGRSTSGGRGQPIALVPGRPSKAHPYPFRLDQIGQLPHRHFGGFPPGQLLVSAWVERRCWPRADLARWQGGGCHP